MGMEGWHRLGLLSSPISVLMENSRKLSSGTLYSFAKLYSEFNGGEIRPVS